MGTWTCRGDERRACDAASCLMLLLVADARTVFQSLAIAVALPDLGAAAVLPLPGVKSICPKALCAAAWLHVLQDLRAVPSR